MSKTAALFSGQGSQYPGMGQELYENFAYVRDIYDCGGDILGFDLRKLSFEGTEEQLAMTQFAQPAIFALSVSAFTAAAREAEFKPDCVAGHSLGEYAALYCAGAFGLEDGFHVIKARGAAMSGAADGGAAMYAIMGSSEDEVRAACEETDGFVVPVNFNQPGQTVISGKAEPAAAAAGVLAAKGAKAVRLSVSGAFHTALMAAAAEQFRAEISGISFSPLRLGFYSNLTGGRLEIGDYPDYFARHMVSPVLFSQEMRSMADDGVETCAEFGPKRTLATLAKKNVKSMKAFGVEDISSLEKLREAGEALA